MVDWAGRGFPAIVHPSREEREQIQVATALRRARMSSSWKLYLRTLNWELEWYFHCPFYQL